MSFRQPSILPGFGLTFGFTTVFLSTIVLLPLAALVLAAGSMHWSDFVHTVFSPRALGSYWLSFGASLWPPASTSCSASSSPDAGALRAWARSSMH